jgi:hypothetical protein
MNCNKELYLEIEYQCENEGIKKKDKIPVHIDNYKDINITLKCPVDENNDKFKSKCEAVYINNFDKENEINNLIDIKKSLYECKYPIYNIPIITKNINNYKKIKAKYSNLELKDYDNKINEKIKDLKTLEAEKYIKLKKIQTGDEITMNEAYDTINNYSLDKLVNNSKEKWKLYNGYDAVQNLFNDNDDNNDNPLIKYYGLVYTIEDAIMVANEYEEKFFVWYNNSYELDNFSSKLFFVDIYNIDQNIYEKTNWTIHENVTTAILKFDLENFSDNNTSEEEYDLYNMIYETINGQNDVIKELKNSYINITDNLNEKNLNNVIIKNLNDKITTYGQSISMNNYETNIYNKIMMALYAILFITIVIFVIIIVYYNNKSAGKIKLFGQ